MLKPLQNEDQYHAALSRVYDLIQANPDEGSAEFTELQKLTSFIQAYEAAENILETRIGMYGYPVQTMTGFTMIFENTTAAKLKRRRRILLLLDWLQAFVWVAAS
jgi:antitoxin component HigA of HigAB toxin-antitoxin module